MKLNVIVIAVMLIGIVHPGSAQNAAADPVRDRLFIQYRSGVFGTWSQYGGGVATYSEWRYFHGFERISEAEFLRIAGYQDEAAQADRHATINRWLVGGGVAFSAAGLVSAVIGVAIDPFQHPFGSAERETAMLRADVALFTGATLALLGIVPMSIAIARGENWLPLEQAYAIAEHHNRHDR